MNSSKTGKTAKASQKNVKAVSKQLVTRSKTSNIQKETVALVNAEKIPESKMEVEEANITEDVISNELNEEENLHTNEKEENEETDLVENEDTEKMDVSDPFITPQDCLVIDTTEADENVESDDNKEEGEKNKKDNVDNNKVDENNKEDDEDNIEDDKDNKEDDEDNKEDDEDNKEDDEDNKEDDENGKDDEDKTDDEDNKTIDEDDSKATKLEQKPKQHGKMTNAEYKKLDYKVKQKIARSNVLLIKKIVLFPKVPNVDKFECIKQIIIHWMNGTLDYRTKAQIRNKYIPSETKLQTHNKPIHQKRKEEKTKHNENKIKNKSQSSSNSKENTEKNKDKTSTDTKERENKNKPKKLENIKRKLVDKSGEPSTKRSKPGIRYQFDKKIQPLIQPSKSRNAILNRQPYKRNDRPEYTRKTNNQSRSSNYNPQRFRQYDSRGARNQNLIDRTRQQPTPWMNTTNNMTNIIAEALQKAQANIFEQRIADTVAIALRQNLSTPNLFNPGLTQPQPVPLLQQKIDEPSYKQPNKKGRSSDNKRDSRERERRDIPSLFDRRSPSRFSNYHSVAKDERKYGNNDKYDYSRKKESKTQTRKEYRSPERSTSNYYANPTTSTSYNTPSSNQYSPLQPYQSTPYINPYGQSAGFSSDSSFDKPYQYQSTLKSNSLESNIAWRKNANHKDDFDKAFAAEIVRREQSRYSNYK